MQKTSKLRVWYSECGPAATGFGPPASKNGPDFEKKIVKSKFSVFKYAVLKMGGKSKDNTERSFESAFAELQDILRELGGQGVALDALVEKYARAKSCLEICRKRLSDAEMQVKKLGPDGAEAFEE